MSAQLFIQNIYALSVRGESRLFNPLVGRSRRDRRVVGAGNFNIQYSISNVQVAGVISHAKPPAFAKATVGKPRREGESWQGCLARLFDQRSTINDEQPTTTAPNYFQFQLRTQRMMEE